MKIEKVTGIVLSDTNYSESSKILNVLTKEHGKIGIISKGCSRRARIRSDYHRCIKRYRAGNQACQIGRASCRERV